MLQNGLDDSRSANLFGFKKNSIGNNPASKTKVESKAKTYRPTQPTIYSNGNSKSGSNYNSRQSEEAKPTVKTPSVPEKKKSGNVETPAFGSKAKGFFKEE